MQILVQIEKTYTIDVTIYDTIENIKQAIEDKTNISYEKQLLIFNGKELKNNMRLIDYNIANLSVLNVSFVTNKQSTMTLDIDLSNVSPFGNQDQSMNIIECDNIMSFESIINNLGLSYWAKYLKLMFSYKKNCKNEICFKYEQIKNKTAFDIKNSIHTQFIEKTKHYKHKLYVKLHFRKQISSLPKQVIIQSEFISKLTTIFDTQNKHHQLEIDIMMQLIELMSTIKSHDILFSNIVNCLCAFTAGGITKMDDNSQQYLIHSLVNAIRYANSTDETLTKLVQCVTNIFSNSTSIKGVGTQIQILDMLKEFCDPCEYKNCLNNLSFVYNKLVFHDYFLIEIAENAFEQLYTFILYDDDENVLLNALELFEQYLKECPDLLKRDINDNCMRTTRLKYQNKMNQNWLIFNGFIRQSLTRTNIEYLPHDLFMVMFNFYGYDYCSNMPTNIIWRVIDLFKKTNNGYSQKILNKTVNLIGEIITPLEEAYDIDTCKNAFWNHGFINGLFVLIQSGGEIYAMDNDGPDLCEECGEPNSLGSYDTDDVFNCRDCCYKCLRIDCIDILKCAVKMDSINDLCLNEIACLNKTEVWKMLTEEQA